MSRSRLQAHIGSRDRLALQAEQAGSELHDLALDALDHGDLDAVRQVIARHERELCNLSDNLRAYQSELRAQAEALADSQAVTEGALARFAVLFAGMPVAVLLVGADGQLIEHNSQASALFNFRPNGPSHRFLHRLVDDTDFRQTVWPAVAARQVAHCEPVNFISESGRRFSGEMQLAPMPAVSGQVATVACAVIDRSEQIQQLQALRQANATLETQRALLAESARLAQVGGFELGLDGTGFVASPELCWLLGWPEAAVSPPPTLDGVLALCDQPGRLALQAALQQVQSGGQPFHLKLNLHTVQGRPLQALASGRCQALSDGRSKVLGLVQDIGPQLQTLAAREAAEAANRAKSAFLSRMSHELRTPLNAVLGFTQLMRMEFTRGEVEIKPRRLELMEQAARHLLDVVNEVLDVSRVESGQIALNVRALPVQPLVQACLALVDGLAEGAQVRLVERPVTVPDLQVLADELRLKEVLINLLGNGIKYNQPSGQVQVSVTADEARVHIAVTDTGRGMNDAALAQLFQPFNRLGAESTGIEGTGLGLYVAHRFVELMNGSLDVTSRPGQGSTFVLTLPRA